MRCIFCKEDSLNSKSIEHILPESLGGNDITLPKGIVCDSCNNYFSRKIERPLLESDEFKYLRFHHGIKSKKGKIPAVNVFYNYTKQFNLSYDAKDNKALIIEDLSIINEIINNKKGSFIIPVIGKSADNKIVSRFLAKMAVEYLAKKMLEVENWNEVFINNEGLEAIRKYVRSPKRVEEWEYTRRKVYDMNIPFLDGDEYYQVLNEMDILVINQEKIDKDTFLLEMYFVVIICGIEYAINLSGSDISGYKQYLRDNDYISPLYIGKNNDSSIDEKSIIKSKI